MILSTAKMQFGNLQYRILCRLFLEAQVSVPKSNINLHLLFHLHFAVLVAFIPILACQVAEQRENLAHRHIFKTFPQMPVSGMYKSTAHHRFVCPN